MARYWNRFAPLGGLPVHFPTMPEGRNLFRWTGVYGVQIGPWFFGAIRGQVVPRQPAGLEEGEG